MSSHENSLIPTLTLQKIEKRQAPGNCQKIPDIFVRYSFKLKKKHTNIFTIVLLFKVFGFTQHDSSVRLWRNPNSIEILIIPENNNNVVI